MADSATDLKTTGIRTLLFRTVRGVCLLCYTPRPFILSRIVLPGRESACLHGPCESMATAAGQARAIALMITNHFSGKGPERFSAAQIPDCRLNWERLTVHEQTVLRTVRTVPCGATRSYGEIAAQAGFAGGGRFVGNTLAKNPFPVIVPCHRVIRSDGRLGGFSAGTQMKQFLLSLESGPAGSKTGAKETATDSNHRLSMAFIRTADNLIP